MPLLQHGEAGFVIANAATQLCCGPPQHPAPSLIKSSCAVAYSPLVHARSRQLRANGSHKPLSLPPLPPPDLSDICMPRL